MHGKDAEGMANSVDPNPTAPSETVCSGSLHCFCPRINIEDYYGTYYYHHFIARLWPMLLLPLMTTQSFVGAKIQTPESL